KKPPLSAEEFIELCHGFGAGGAQMGFDQLISTDAAYLKNVRALAERYEMFLELGVSARALESEDAFAKVAAAAAQLGATRLRVAGLSGRRYEDFAEMAKWQEFATHWKQVLRG